MAETEMPQLLPCPMCGGEAKLIRTDLNNNPANPAIRHVVACLDLNDDCGMESPCCPSPAVAIKLWNRRARSSLLDVAVWQPIETATKDSHSRLVWCPDRQNIYLVSWDPFSDPKSEWTQLHKPGWAHFGGRGRLLEEPTHWQPLPARPAIQAISASRTGGNPT